MDDFCAARPGKIPALPWPNLQPPYTDHGAMTKPKKPKLPTSGGSYVVQTSGNLKQTEATKPKPPRSAAAPTEKKET